MKLHKWSLGIFILSILFVTVFLSACENKEVNKSKENKVTVSENRKEYSEDNFRKIIRENILENSNEYKKEGDIPAILIDIIKINEKEDGYNVFANIIDIRYSFSNGIFKEEGGALYPVRYDINKDLQIVKIHNTMDGTYFEKSILEMAEGDKKLKEKLMGSQVAYSDKYNELMEELKKEATAKGLENFTHKLEEITGYEKDVKYINEHNHSEKGICVIKTEKYNKLQEERKQIVPPEVGGTHWVYAPCIYFHESTGICVEGILDYSN